MIQTGGTDTGHRTNEQTHIKILRPPAQKPFGQKIMYNFQIFPLENRTLKTKTEFYPRFTQTDSNDERLDFVRA